MSFKRKSRLYLYNSRNSQRYINAKISTINALPPLSSHTDIFLELGREELPHKICMQNEFSRIIYSNETDRLTAKHNQT